MEVTITVDGCGSFDASITKLACSFLHHIAARIEILPYTNMVKWIIDDVDIPDR